MAIKTPIDFDWNLYYVPEEFHPPGTCVNYFQDIPELMEYIDDDIQDVYLASNQYEDTHVGREGQILDQAVMTIKNSHGDELDIKIYNRHLTRNEIRFELRGHLEGIKEIFKHKEP